jgi:hypothetical protein
MVFNPILIFSLLNYPARYFNKPKEELPLSNPSAIVTRYFNEMSSLLLLYSSQIQFLMVYPYLGAYKRLICQAHISQTNLIP